MSIICLLSKPKKLSFYLILVADAVFPRGGGTNPKGKMKKIWPRSWVRVQNFMIYILCKSEGFCVNETLIV